MTHDRDIQVYLRYNHHQKEWLPFGKMSFFEELYVDAQVEKLPQGLRLRLALHPKMEVTVNELSIRLAHQFASTDHLLCNGFLSDSETREHTSTQKIKSLRPFASSLHHRGDYGHPLLRQAGGGLHSWSYAYIRQQDQYLLIGSLSEDKGFVLIRYFPTSDEIKIDLDATNFVLNHSFPAMEIALLEGTKEKVFEAYYLLGQKKDQQPLPPPLTCLVASELPVSSEKAKAIYSWFQALALCDVRVVVPSWRRDTLLLLAVGNRLIPGFKTN